MTEEQAKKQCFSASVLGGKFSEMILGAGYRIPDTGKRRPMTEEQAKKQCFSASVLGGKFSEMILGTGCRIPDPGYMKY